MPELSLRAFFRPTVMLAFALMAVIVMMILPMPAWVLDMGLACSFALAILIFTVTLFIERPLDFSSFPTVLLASLMLRLSLNVSSTKLIIGQGHTGTGAAGSVIEGFASFVMSGSIILGLVVFCVLLIVNFIVITKGATRMAEVGARFALDGMPGKQLAIDSDMSAGAIDHAEAKRRRELEQAETTFFGSLDGASKFVKGDAIAGLLITLMNLVMGLVIGITVHDLTIASAFETYAILTVGDGLVSQIPAVIISIASALLLARGGASGAVDMALVAQLGKYPAALGTVSVILLLFAFVPGLPFVPFVLGALVLIGAGYWTLKTQQETEAQEAADIPTAEPAPEKQIGDLLHLEDIHVEFAPDLVSLALDPHTGLDGRVSAMRDHIVESYGIILPDIRMTDDPSLPIETYRIKIQGVVAAQDRLHTGKVLVLLGEDAAACPPGDDVREPVYGAPARWISAAQEQQMAEAGFTVVTSGEVLATHLLEVVKNSLERLLSYRALQRLLQEFTALSDTDKAEANRRFLEEMVPDKVAPDTLLAVLRLLLAERVSVRNLGLILETVAETRHMNLAPEAICEHVRQRLGYQIVAELKREDSTLPLVQLAPEWESAFETYEVPAEKGRVDIALPPEMFRKLSKGMSEKINEAAERGTFAAVITSARRRRFLRTLLQTRGMTNPVLSFEELPQTIKPAIVGHVAA